MNRQDPHCPYYPQERRSTARTCDPQNQVLKCTSQVSTGGSKDVAAIVPCVRRDCVVAHAHQCSQQLPGGGQSSSEAVGPFVQHRAIALPYSLLATGKAPTTGDGDPLRSSFNLQNNSYDFRFCDRRRAIDVQARLPDFRRATCGSRTPSRYESFAPIRQITR